MHMTDKLRDKPEVNIPHVDAGKEKTTFAFGPVEAQPT